MKHRGLNQLLTAALINERFRETLLHHPARAISTGYSDHTFSLTSEEQALVVGIRAERLEDCNHVHGEFASTEGGRT